jgi:hypothetical protein
VGVGGLKIVRGAQAGDANQGEIIDDGAHGGIVAREEGVVQARCVIL